MSHEHTSLDAAATERKARLAKLAALKRKRPETDTPANQDGDSLRSTADEPSSTDRYISGRNYDVTTKGPKLGFDQQPTSQQETVEQEAHRLAETAAEQSAKDEAEAEKGIDLFKLQPKKANWDLKRELAERMRVVDVRTQNAIAKLVRERIEKARQEASRNSANSTKSDGGEELGVEGSTLVEAVHLREKENEDERRRQEIDDAEGIS